MGIKNKPCLLAARIPHMRNPAQHMFRMNMCQLQVDEEKKRKSRPIYWQLESLARGLQLNTCLAGTCVDRR
jgi:hypothetical protein